MDILSLDLSSQSSGWSIGNAKTLKKYGCITSSDSNWLKRVIYMKDEVMKVIKENDIEEIVIEEVKPEFNNSHTYKVLMYLQSAVRLAIYEYNPKIKVAFMLPSVWRSKLGIKTGRGIKRQQQKASTMQYVEEHYGLKVNDDIADSVGLLYAYIKSEAIVTF